MNPSHQLLNLSHCYWSTGHYHGTGFVQLCSTFNMLRTCRDDIVHWYLATTDAGPNEIGARKIIHADTKDTPNVLFVDTTCLEHSQHLVALSCLKAADRCLKKFRDWSYYSSLATCSNVCRDVCKSLYRAWLERFGHQSANSHVRTLWPKACSGRLTGCDKPEARFLQCTQEKLSPLLHDLLRAKENKPGRKDRASCHDIS